MDSDFKRKVEQAAMIQLAASFLKIPQAMRATDFTDEDSKSAAKQMQVRRAQDAMQKSTQTKDTLAINAVTVPSRCSLAANFSVSTLTSPSVPAGGGAAVLPVLPEGVEDIRLVNLKGHIECWAGAFDRQNFGLKICWACTHSNTSFASF